MLKGKLLGSTDMEETAFFGLLAASVLMGALVLHRRKETREEARLRREKLVFHAVSIKSGNEACQAAQYLKGVRFLAQEAPGLPLPGCHAAECTCVYVHYDDRRFHNRRDVYMNKVYLAAEVEVERRHEAGRRKTDRPSLQAAH